MPPTLYRVHRQATEQQKRREAILRTAETTGDQADIIRAQLELGAALREAQYWTAHVETAEAVRQLEITEGRRKPAAA